MPRRISYPFVPKTIKGLRLGDYCLLLRTDGRVVPLVFICPQTRSSRSYFFGSIANIVLPPSMDSELPGAIALGPTAMLHVECFERNGTPIVGNLGEHLSPREVHSLIDECYSPGIGTRTSVWGYRTPFKYANAVDPPT